MKRCAVRDLSAAAVDVKPVDYDWSAGMEQPEGYAWETVFLPFDAWTKAQMRAWLEGEGYSPEPDCSHEQLREQCIDAAAEGRFEPMMSYYYPLPDLGMDPADAQEAILGTACVVALVDGEPVLALGGGGMDLRWDICEAYMLLGLLPPVHFVRLPEFASQALTSKARWVLAGCKESCRIMRRRIQGNLEHLRHVRKRLEGND